MNKPPSPQNPSEPGEVSLRAAITDSSLSVSARSRTVTALDRLFGGLIGIPAAWLERKEAEVRNRSSIDAVLQDVSPALDGPLLTDDQADAILADQALVSQLAPLINKIRVAERAVALLSQENQGDDDAETDAESEPLEQDWLTHFASYAEKESSEEVRNLWAKVLAGEIRKKGSFSLSSLRLLSELDRRMATTFEREMQYRLNGEAILQPKSDEVKNDRLEDLCFLEDVGLIRSPDPVGGITRTIRPVSKGRGFVREKNLVLAMEFTGKVQIKIIPLTRAGREIASILDPVDPYAVLEKVGAAVDDQVDAMEIRRIIQDLGENSLTAHLKTLKKRAT